MNNQCPVCGTLNAEGDAFCNNCGNPLSRPSLQTQQPYQPYQAYQPRPRTAPANSLDQVKSIARTIMRYISFILIGLTILTLVLSILNFTGGYSVNVTATGSAYGEKVDESKSVKLSELFDSKEADTFAPLALCSRAYGVFHLILTVLSGLIVAKIFQGNRKIRNSVNTYALVGLIGSILFLVFFWITGIYESKNVIMQVKLTFHPHFTVWLSIVLFGLLFALNLLAKKKRRRR